VFEEAGVVKTPFYGGFGLLAVGSIPKPAFNAFALLHRLGEQRFTNDAEGTLFTRRNDGSLVLAIWNYADIGGNSTARSVVLKLRHIEARSASVESLDREHGNVNVAYAQMGSPRYPTQIQLAELRTAAALPVPVERSLDGGMLNLEIPPDGLMLVTIAVTPPRTQ
jgi:xylan 1,4-beta-xylosidase